MKRAIRIDAALMAAALIVISGSIARADDWLYARPDYAWSFPRDHWAHPAYRSEWWYLTGHLEATGPAPRNLGYQFTFFRIGLLAEQPPSASAWEAKDLVMGHAAITDLDTGEHIYSELLYRAAPLLGAFTPPPDMNASGAPAPPAESLIAWCRAPAGTDTTWTLRWNGEAFNVSIDDEAKGIAFTLATRPQKPVALEGPNGFSRKGAAASAASQYYSFTRLQTGGTVSIGGVTLPVRGTSWMDHEFGSGTLDPQQTGWDWFSLQLDDGREIMLYLLRGGDTVVDYARGTLVEKDGATRDLSAGDFAVRATGRWKSPVTQAVYPSGWTVTIAAADPPISIEVISEVKDQENRGRLARALFYWEGAVRAQSEGGAPAGLGYVELTGYGTNNRPAL